MSCTFHQPDIADVFENVLVPAVFKPYALALVEHARPIGPSDRVLDLGCGTGIVARVLRDRLGGASSLTGLDVSAPMIAKARSIVPEISWVEGTAMALPFPDRSFDLVLSQQMLQFVPDPATAAREIRRVLAPGGRLIATTWRPRNAQPLFEVIGQLAERHLGKANDRRWSLDGDAVCAVLATAGFTEIEHTTCSLVDEFARFPVRGSTLAANHDTAGLEPTELEARLAAIEAESAAVLAPFARPEGGYRAPSITNVVVATAGGAS